MVIMQKENIENKDNVANIVIYEDCTANYAVDFTDKHSSKEFIHLYKITQ